MPGGTGTLGETSRILELLDGNLVCIWYTEDATAVWVLEMIMEKM